MQIIKSTIIFVILFCVQNLNAQIDLSSNQNSALVLLIDRTKTLTGREFYIAFNSNWKAEFDEDYIITVEEAPAPGRTTTINIKLNNFKIWTRRLQPNRQYSKQLGAFATRFVEQYIRNKAEIEKELGGEDLKGSGVF